jgi:hypothetical protein
MRVPILLLLAAACAAGPDERDLPAGAETADLFVDGRLAARAVLPAYDRGDHDATCKVFHHVWAPDGQLLTKGLGGQHPHHRGLFFGFNRVQVGGQRFDFWHCGAGESQRTRGAVAASELGLEGDWQVLAIDWCDREGTPLAVERRALRATAIARGQTAFDVVIELRAGARAVRFDGDPQHSGHQFRGLQAFAEPQAPPVRYLRPDGAQQRGDDVWIACDWIAALLPLPAGAVTVLRIEHPENPGPVGWSTRAYGRFGATFAHLLQPGSPLRLRYRYVVALGELDPAACAALAAAYRTAGSAAPGP